MQVITATNKSELASSNNVANMVTALVEQELNAPYNMDGRAYKGGNATFLSAICLEQGYATKQFGTYKALQANGLQVAKGYKGYKIEFSATVDDQYVRRSYTVFNVAQCTPIELEA